MEGKRYKNLPISVFDFHDMISSDFCYVDKTILIQRLLDYQERVILFTRPRRFGKSLAMSMLRCFFDCNEREENRTLFDGLSVAQSEHHMVEQGKYPVIYLNFTDVKAASWEGAQRDLVELLSSCYRRYKYLLDSEALDEDEKRKLKRLRSEETSLALFRSSLRFMCDILHRHHGQPVVLLIDEYDVPIQGAYKHNYFDEMIDFMRAFMAAGLKDNSDLRLAVLTGVMRIAKESLFSGLNNLEVDTIVSENYADCFGFTPTEVDQMLSYYDRQDKKGELQEWYDGYRFGNQDIYNPWSVLNYFKQNCKPQPYWLDTSGNDLTLEFLSRLVDQEQAVVLDLYRNGTVTAAVDTAVSYQQLDSQQENILFSLLAVTGYLKPVEHIEEDVYRLKIPNNEIRRVFRREIVNRLERNLGLKDLQNLYYFLLGNQPEQFEAALKQLLIHSASYFDTDESFYQGLMLGLLMGLRDKYEVFSNREAGLGRADLLLQPCFNTILPGFVFELKRSDAAADLNALAEAALNQIREKRYVEAFASNIREIRCYGLAFCTKECALRTECVKR